jgi:polysaccharide biosynthesis transport protein
MQNTHETPRYATLGDYLRVIRRRRLLIAVVTLLCFGAALANALVKDDVYVAETQIQFRDPLADLELVGIGGETLPELAPNQRSALNAELVTRPQVTRGVARELDTPVSPSGLRAAVSARVNPQTNLVVVEASWGNARFAAELANAYADAAREVAIQEFRARLDRAEDAITQQLEEARDDLPAPTDPTGGATAGGTAFRVAALEQNLTQIRSLADVADPVQIASRAEVPGSPASPRPVRDSLLGLVVGLVLGLLLAFVRDSLDRRLRSAHEVHEELDLPVLGLIGETAFAHAGLARNGGLAILESDFEPFRMLRMNLGSLRGNGASAPRSVLVTSALPGEGKSTVSMSLASAAALAGQRVLLVECDLRRPSLARRLKLETQPGLTDYLGGSASPTEILQVVPLTPPRPLGTRAAPARPEADDASMVCITAGLPVPTAPELLQSRRFHEFLAKVVKVYDLVVLDASPLLAVSDPLEIVPHADAVLVCVRAQQTTREQARAVRSALGHLPERPAGAVLTGLHPGDDSYGYYYGY